MFTMFNKEAKTSCLSKHPAAEVKAQQQKEDPVKTSSTDTKAKIDQEFIHPLSDASKGYKRFVSYVNWLESKRCSNRG